MKIELYYYSLPYKLIDYNVWYAGAYRLGAMLLAVILGTCLLSLVSKHRIPWISNAGRNTIYVFLLHGFVIKWLVAMDVPSRFDSLSSKLLVIMFAILLTLLLSSPIISKVNKSIIYSPLLIKEEIKSRTY